LNFASQARFAPLPPEHISEWLSTCLVRGYRGREFPSRLRLLGWLRRLAGNKRIVAAVRRGARMALDDRDLIQGQLLYSGCYELEVTELFERELRVGDQFVDIGANVGYYSMLAHACGAQVVAFEPDPLNAAIWRLNVSLNRGEHCMRLCELGLGSIHGDMLFHRTAAGNTGRGGFLTQDGVESLRVPVRRLDDLSTELGLRANAVWKMDVEGFEGEVLKGAERALRDTSPRLVLFEAELREIDTLPYRLLEDAGYVIQHVPRHSGERDAKENYLARRRDG
jgi:FkbM family methyltransferase